MRVFNEIFTRRQTAFGRSLLFAIRDDQGDFVDVSTLTTPVIRFRLRTQQRSDAVTGAGTLQDYSDTLNDPPRYNTEYLWSDQDPDTPGVYLFELDADDGSGNVITYPLEARPYLVRIAHDVGGP